MRRRLGIALFALGFIILFANGVAVIGHYLVGWSIPSPVNVPIGVMFLVVGMMMAAKKKRWI